MYSDTMNKYVPYIHGDTGIELSIVVDLTKSGDVEIKKVVHNGEDILPILGEDVIIDMELYCENLFQVTDEQ